jgi:hypothetical protein
MTTTFKVGDKVKGINGGPSGKLCTVLAVGVPNLTVLVDPPYDGNPIRHPSGWGWCSHRENFVLVERAPFLSLEPAFTLEEITSFTSPE